MASREKNGGDFIRVEFGKSYLVHLIRAPLIIYIFIGHAEVSVLAAFAALAIVPAILVVLIVRGKLHRVTSASSGSKLVVSRSGEAYDVRARELQIANRDN